MTNFNDVLKRYGQSQAQSKALLDEYYDHYGHWTRQSWDYFLNQKFGVHKRYRQVKRIR